METQSRARVVLSVAGDIAAICSALALGGMVIVTAGTAMMRVRASVAPSQSGAQTRAQPGVSVVSGLTTGDGIRSIHPAEAVGAIVEFADFECAYCGKFARDTYPILKRDFVDTKLVAYVYRDFPLESRHPQAVRASTAAECAGAQGKYWEMHDELFSKPGALGDEQLTAIARAVGVQSPAFAACMRNDIKEKVHADQEEGRLLGVTVTPTFFIGRIQADGRIAISQKIVGAQPIEVFRRAIEGVLAVAPAKDVKSR